MPNRKIFYKYRGFDARTIDLLWSDSIYCAHPTSFNDPLEAQACINVDVSVPELEFILHSLIQRRVTIAMKKNASSLKIDEKNVREHIEKISSAIADNHIAQLKYSSSDQGESIRSLGNDIEKEVIEAHDSGIFCLSEQWNCPLMWSHYGDQHRGICLGYEIPDEAEKKLYQVIYGGDREFKASDILRALEGDNDARIRLYRDILLTKAKPWKYEHEWRYIDSVGPKNSPFILKSITFGYRSERSAIYSIYSTLQNRSGSPIKYYFIQPSGKKFNLQRQQLTETDIAGDFPKNNYNDTLFMEELFGKEYVERNTSDPLCPPESSSNKKF